MLNNKPVTMQFIQTHPNWFETTIDAETLSVTARTVEGIFPAQLYLMGEAVRWPHPDLKDPWDTGSYLSGSTEPWIAEVVASLLKCIDAKTVIECGGYLGNTSAWLALALQEKGGGDLTIIELEADRAAACEAKLAALPLSLVTWRVVQDDVFRALAMMPAESVDFAWVDDTHAHDHVDRELATLIPKMRRNGIITGHDVYGTCDLAPIFRKHGGYALDCPRLGPAGGIGILQVR